MKKCENESIYEHILLIDELMKPLWFQYLNKINEIFNLPNLYYQPDFFLYNLFANHPCMVKHYKNDLSFLRAHLREYTVLRARTLLTMMETYISTLQKSISKYKYLIFDLENTRKIEMKYFSSFGGQNTTFGVVKQKDINKFIINITYQIYEDNSINRQQLFSQFYKTLNLFKNNNKHTPITIDITFSKTNYLHTTTTVVINSHTQLIININTYRKKNVIHYKPKHEHENHVSSTNFALFLGIAAIVNKNYQIDQ